MKVPEPKIVLPARLEQARQFINDAWLESSKLRSGHATWLELADSLPKYGTAGVLINEWHRDWYLMGCRRLADRGTDTNSLRSGLGIIKNHAASVTEALITDVALVRHSQHGSFSSRWRDEIRQQRHELLRGIVTRDDSTNYGGRLTEDAVQHDIERLWQAAKPVTEFVNDRIGHRNAEPDTRLDFGQVDRFLQVVEELTALWLNVLDGSDPRVRTRPLSGATPLRTALDLFEWNDYCLAREEAERRLGMFAPEFDGERVRESARLHYEFDVQ